MLLDGSNDDSAWRERELLKIPFVGRFTELLEQEGYGVLFLSIAGALFFFGLSGVNKASDSSGGTRAFHGVTGTLSLIGAGLAGVLGVFLLLVAVVPVFPSKDPL